MTFETIAESWRNEQLERETNKRETLRNEEIEYMKRLSPRERVIKIIADELNLTKKDVELEDDFTKVKMTDTQRFDIRHQIMTWCECKLDFAQYEQCKTVNDILKMVEESQVSKK